jgi:hypothetical protein
MTTSTPKDPLALADRVDATDKTLRALAARALRGESGVALEREIQAAMAETLSMLPILSSALRHREAMLRAVPVEALAKATWGEGTCTTWDDIVEEHLGADEDEKPSTSFTLLCEGAERMRSVLLGGLAPGSDASHVDPNDAERLALTRLHVGWAPDSIHYQERKSLWLKGYVTEFWRVTPRGEALLAELDEGDSHAAD